jgi:manganese/iron transport system permease protein
MEILHYDFFRNALIACFLGGISCSLIGVFVITMEMPFLGVAMSHAAFAGAVFGLLAGVHPIAAALVFCLLASFIIGPLSEASSFRPDTSIGVIFSIMIGAGFLGLSLIQGPKTQALSLIWGSILTVSDGALYFMAAVCAAVIMTVVLLFKELKAVIFHRGLAATSGIPDKTIFYVILVLSGAVVTANLNTIGGLLIFSLIINPAAAAFQLTFDLKKMFLLSSLFGVASCFAGLILSTLFNIPSGAVIILVSSGVFLVCLWLSPKRRAGIAGREF